jgi:hypothetical protein
MEQRENFRFLSIFPHDPFQLQLWYIFSSKLSRFRATINDSADFVRNSSTDLLISQDKLSKIINNFISIHIFAFVIGNELQSNFKFT